MGVSRRHHTVPNFYLKGFATAVSKPMIDAFSLEDGTRRTISTRDATVRKNFYTLSGHPAGDDVFEKDLSDLEAEASAVIRKAVDGTWPLSREDRDVLGTFLTFQFRRGPDARALMDKIHGTVLSKTISQMGADGLRDSLARSGKEVRDDVLDRLVQQASRPDGISMKTSPAEHILHMLELVPDLARYFVGRPWTLVRFSRKKLLTCDTPVSLIRDPALDGVFTGVGLMNAWGISIPLTREVGLHLGNPQALLMKLDDRRTSAEFMDEIVSGGHDHERPGSAKLAQQFNNRTIANARNWLFHHPEDADLVPEDLPDPRDREVESEVITG